MNDDVNSGIETACGDGRIRVLSPEVSQRIAAGEVIERPSSIVKELLENALDAGATEVALSWRQGGRDEIRVADNGRGIAVQDLPLAFARHGTSKIRVFEDIDAIGSYGFRGEALASIASVCRVELTSRTAGSVAGARIVGEDGRVGEAIAVGCPVGTQIVVSRIFDGVPVRKKFIKTPATEHGHCLDAVFRAALVTPQVAIRVLADGREALYAPATRDFTERMRLLLGADSATRGVPVDGTAGDLQLRGWISRPEATRSSGRQIYLFVNGRSVHDAFLQHAVLQACRRLIGAGRYPSAVLRYTLPSPEVDVNVHPAKREVRFREPRRVFSLTLEVLSGAFMHLPVPPPESPGPGGFPAAFPPPRSAVAPSSRWRRYLLPLGEAAPRLTLRSAEPPAGDAGFAGPKVEPAGEPPAPQQEPFRFADLRYLGAVGGTYLVFTLQEDLILLDQHAAHERVLMQRLLRREAEQTLAPPGQRLLIPETLTLSPQEEACWRGCAEMIEAAGWEVESFGTGAVMVRAVPAILVAEDPRVLFRDLLSACQEAERLPDLADRRERLLTFHACRGAIKARTSLSAAEVAALCRDLDQTPFTATCPHGRPVWTFLGRDELARRFKRK